MLPKIFVANLLLSIKLSSLMLLVLVAGCGGCRKSIDRLTDEERKKLAEEKREAIETKQPTALPADFQSAAITLKPGHWVETTQLVKANQEDLQILATGDVLLGTERLPISGTNIVNEYARATALPKGQSKSISLQYFVPRSGEAQESDGMSQSLLVKLRTRLLSRPLLVPIEETPYIVNALRPEQYEFVVLTPQPLLYEYLAAIDFVRWRGSDLMEEELCRSYHVTLMQTVDSKLALPSSLLTMTSIAVILWDDFAPEDFSAEQKTALLDWLHWGGQLVISGPGSWSRLQNSFLLPYLPINSADAVELKTDDFLAISTKWSVPDLARPERDPLQIVGAAIPGLKYGLAADAQWLPYTNEMVAEKNVGRGRIVVTGFPLRDPRIFRWKYFSNFFSTGILRRPARTVERIATENTLQQQWAAPHHNMEADPRLNTNLRIASRDLPLSSSNVPNVNVISPMGTLVPATQATKQAPAGTSFGITTDAEVEVRPPLPVYGTNALESVQWSENGAAWNDLSGIAFQVVSTLRAAAGIELPERWTITWLVAAYLACLVPLNWLVFRIIGRLELAWLAAPFIAIVGVVIVTKVARLDIGFASRTTELSLLELHGDYPRGHLTRYLALYTSLSTNYALDLPDPGRVALPLGNVTPVHRRLQAAVRNLRTTYGTTPGMRLEPLTVYSNSTEMVHGEQMVGFPGGMQYQTDGEAGTATLVNGTSLALQGCMIVRRHANGEYQHAWLDSFAAGQTAQIKFQSATRKELWSYWNRSQVTRWLGAEATDSGEPSTTTASARLPRSSSANPPPASDQGALALGGILHELVEKVPLVPGQTRLFAYTDQRPGTLTISPAEDQLDSRCVVMAHLTPMNPTEITPDVKIVSRVPGPVDLNDPTNNEFK